MRLPDDRFDRRLAKAGLLIGACAALAGCAGPGPGLAVESNAALPANGPQADYPALVGDPYVIDGVSYKPVDTLNYDEVGMSALDAAELQSGVTAAHHTLPVPSYIEVTSLTTGRTILARVEHRGPMDGHALVALSPAAMAQLQANAEEPVRVRRVNPPEAQRALLRAGQSAPLRMDTPLSLVEVLRRRLPQGQGQAAPIAPPAVAQRSDPPPIETFDPGQSTVAAEPVIESAEIQIDEIAPEIRGEPVAEPVTAERPPSPTGPGFVVQAAAFSTQERADTAAGSLDNAFVLHSGQFWRLRTGPFATRAQAEASLAKVRSAGYTDARILTSG